jgi:hypothetical protein
MGFDKIAEGDFGRARVARRARAEGPSQSLALRQYKLVASLHLKDAVHIGEVGEEDRKDGPLP